MNAVALSCCSRAWRLIKLAIVGFSIGSILGIAALYFDYQCEYCGEKEFGRPNIYEGVDLCGSCFERWQTYNRHKDILQKKTNDEIEAILYPYKKYLAGG